MPTKRTSAETVERHCGVRRSRFQSKQRIRAHEEIREHSLLFLVLLPCQDEDQEHTADEFAKLHIVMFGADRNIPKIPGG